MRLMASASAQAQGAIGMDVDVLRGIAGRCYSAQRCASGFALGKCLLARSAQSLGDDIGQLRLSCIQVGSDFSSEQILSQVIGVVGVGDSSIPLALSALFSA